MRRGWAKGRCVLVTGVLVATALLAGCGTTVSLAERRSLAAGDQGGVPSAGQAGAPDSTAAIPSSASAPALGGTAAATQPGGSGAGGEPTQVTGGGAGGAGPAAGISTGGADAPAATAGGANHSVLTIGLTYIDNSSTTAALGVSTSSSLDQKTVAEALVAGINAAGGLDGRHLKAIEYSFNSDDANWATDAQAACTAFTQDNHVSVVVDTAFGTLGGFEACLQKAGVIDLTTQAEGDQVSSSAADLHANTVSMTMDETYAAVLEGMVASGYLSKANQMGVIVEGCPDDTGAYTQTLVPLINHLGLKPAKEEQVGCTTGFESAGPAATSIQNDILAFRSEGVDRVMFVSYNESVLALLFANSASSQSYQPGYLLSSNAQAQALRSNIPSDQWPQLHGVGNSPTTDVDAAPPSPIDKRCAALSSAGGARMNSYQDGDFVYSECGPFLLLEAALEKTGGNSSAGALMTAIDGLGSSWKGPDLVGSSTYFTKSRHAGPDMVQTFGYVAGCTCMRYTGSPRTAP